MKNKFQINCRDCLKRSTCTKLCERARKFADQDQIPLKEKTLGRPLLYSAWGVWNRYSMPESGVVLNDRQLVVLVLISAGVPNGVIKKGLKMSQAALDNCTRAIKKAYEEKNTDN